LNLDDSQCVPKKCLAAKNYERFGWETGKEEVYLKKICRCRFITSSLSLAGRVKITFFSNKEVIRKLLENEKRPAYIIF
jgi:hypothetical protein